MNLTQELTNRVNAERDFTYNLNENRTGRYVVASSNVWFGTNPSHKYHIISVMAEGIERARSRGCDSIGGWKDKETGIYYVDMNCHYTNRSEAIQSAVANNELAIYDTVTELVINITDEIRNSAL
jgi:hypothetical protein